MSGYRVISAHNAESLRSVGKAPEKMLSARSRSLSERRFEFVVEPTRHVRVYCREYSMVPPPLRVSTSTVDVLPTLTFSSDGKLTLPPRSFNVP